jgi:protein-L-isoaspartate(D-aspartate) O-methyltransferase
MSGFDLQRKNMVESQVRPSDITDRRIMRAMLTIPREAFAWSDTRAIAYIDRDLGVGPATAEGPRRALLAPRVLAQMVQRLEIAPTDRVLEIGAATGYGSAIVASIAKRVVALESDPALAAAATAAITGLALSNVTVVTGPLADGWQPEAPYGAILVGGAVPEIAPSLLDQLRDGGRLAAIILEGNTGRLKIWQRFGATYAVRTVCDASARPLPGFSRALGFVF